MALLEKAEVLYQLVQEKIMAVEVADGMEVGAVIMQEVEVAMF
ncbi:Uncharacterised protein [Clostridioides difficile]|nr:Uncharacterised protein [Clostridioides difficile]